MKLSLTVIIFLGEVSMERLADIIKILSSSLGFVSIDDLAHDLGVTPRTIRNDLMLLENALEGSKIRLVKKGTRVLHWIKRIFQKKQC